MCTIYIWDNSRFQNFRHRTVSINKIRRETRWTHHRACMTHCSRVMPRFRAKMGPSLQKWYHLNFHDGFEFGDDLNIHDGQEHLQKFSNCPNLEKCLYRIHSICRKYRILAFSGSQNWNLLSKSWCQHFQCTGDPFLQDICA